MRADEHEGELNDSELKRQKDKADARAREILGQDLLDLTESGSFLRWFQKYAHPVLMQDVSVADPHVLAQFMGRRQLVLQIIEEMDFASPGFIHRLFAAREAYENELLIATQKEQ